MFGLYCLVCCWKGPRFDRPTGLVAQLIKMNAEKPLELEFDALIRHYEAIARQAHDSKPIDWTFRPHTTQSNDPHAQVDSKDQHSNSNIHLFSTSPNIHAEKDHSSDKPIKAIQQTNLEQRIQNPSIQPSTLE